MTGGNRLLACVLALALVGACGGGTTGKKRQINEPCQYNDDCADQVCHYGLCFGKNPGGAGTPCTGPGDCRSFVCESGTCAEWGARVPGDICIYRDECASHACVAGRCEGQLPLDAGVPDGARPDALTDAPRPDTASDTGRPDLPRPDLPRPDLPRPDLPRPDLPRPDAPAPDTTAPCTSAANCNDGLACTKDTCNLGACSNTLIAGSCLIGGKCYVDGQNDPLNVCERCTAAQSTTAWSNNDGHACDDGQSCTYDDVCSGGSCGGKLFPCDDGLGCTDDQCTPSGPAAADAGVDAGPGLVCTSTLRPGSCLIGGTCYAHGDDDPLGSCRKCDSNFSTSQWALKTGFCEIAGQCYADGVKHAFDSCRQCDPAFSSAEWAPASGCVLTLVGTGAAGFANGPLASATLDSPDGIAVDGPGRVYVAERNNKMVRVVSGGQVTSLYTPVGSGDTILRPAAVEVDNAGNVYFTGDKRGAACCWPWNTAVVWSGSSTLQLLAGPLGGCCGYADGAAGQAAFSQAWGLGVDDAVGSTYVGDGSNHRVRLVAQVAGNWQVSTAAGSGKMGSVDGPVAAAQFTFPRGIAVHQGTVYVAGWDEHRIRVIVGGQVTTLAGGTGPGYQDGPAASSLFNYPADVAVHQGSIYVADAKNHRIRVIEPASGTTDGGVGADGGGGSDGGSAPLWQVKTVAGDGVPGFKDGPSSTAQFNEPRSIDVGKTGLIYVADKFNHRVRVMRR